MAKTIAEINKKIKNGKVVVVTAEEVIDVVRKKGIKKAAQAVDVVTTGTFGPMCSSGVFINFGHSRPKIKAQNVWLNNVPAYGGLAAVDAYIGATAIPEDDPANKVFPGEFRYGGGHVIEDLAAGKDIALKAAGYGTDCYPGKEFQTSINIKSLNEAVLTNPRNAYQNYNVAVNLSSGIIYTYMGALLPNLGNASYCSAGQLSPLLNDPYCETVGIGTRIFLGGGIRYVWSRGTQCTLKVPRTAQGVPKLPAATLAVSGDLKQMSSKYLKGTSVVGYGVSLSIGIGIPIPILNERILKFTTVSDKDIYAPVVDYSRDYPQGKGKPLTTVNYHQLRGGKIKIRGKEIPTSGFSSYKKARDIAGILKNWIEKRKFFLSEPVELFGK